MSSKKMLQGPVVLHPGSARLLRHKVMVHTGAEQTFREFDMNIRAWSCGSVYLELTDEQYGKLKR